jgi:phage terminase small subunit
MGDKQRKLTPKQQAFADYYIETGNASESARLAGYSKKTAQAIGLENLEKPMVKSYIDERMKQIASKRIMDAAEALELLTSIARGELESETIETDGEVGGVSTKTVTKKKDRLKAVMAIGKRHGLFTEKVQLDVEPVVIVDDIEER